MNGERYRKSSPNLSVLIPAYNFAEGVLRIVSPLLSEGRSDIEILIHDDSCNARVEAAIQELIESNACLRYVRNSPALGAVYNWNSLLQNAQGKYVILIHHDDFPLSETFASDLLGELERQDWPDALILSCLTYDVGNKKIRPCVCNFIRACIGRHFPTYLLRRNVIGSPSMLVVRRELFDGYDVGLKWLVDVEAYVRFLTKQKRRLAFSTMMMASSTGMPDAISSTIKSDVKEIADAELAYLEAKYPKNSGWKILRGENLFGKLMLALEKPLWLMIKIADALNRFPRNEVSLSNAVGNRVKSFAVDNDKREECQ